jgi:APA family basic amino acid/polyamine antiporter
MSGLSSKAPITPVAAAGRVGTGSLVAVGSGTAVASVCVIGLFEIEHLVGGIWSVLALATAGAICLFMAYVFARLSDVMPSGAGLITYASRAFNRAFGMAVVVPYLLLMMFLVGFESLIVGGLMERLFDIPAIAGAALFIVATWAVCRSGLRLGYQTQSWATIALFIGLAGVSLMLLIGSAQRGELAMRLFRQVPSVAAFINAVGQALFLFLGFELLTSHVEVARPGAVSRALPLSVYVLFVFYAIVSLGFSVLIQVTNTHTGAIFVPQVAAAEQAGGIPMVAAVALICILASFTSFNGALLALSRFVYALAAQGLLPRHLAILDHKLVARPALTVLLVTALSMTLTVYLLGLHQALILAAAVTASFVYGVSTVTREREPFRGKPNPLRRWMAYAVALGLFGLGLGVIVNAGDARGQLLIILVVVYGLAVLAVWRLSHARSRSALSRPVRGAVPAKAEPGRSKPEVSNPTVGIREISQ